MGEVGDILTHFKDGFGGLVVSMLAYGSRVRGLKPVKESSACLPSEWKLNNLSPCPNFEACKRT
jgi:hypothetical protein